MESGWWSSMKFRELRVRWCALSFGVGRRARGHRAGRNGNDLAQGWVGDLGIPRAEDAMALRASGNHGVAGSRAVLLG
jgi:hypothetical protein